MKFCVKTYILRTGDGICTNLNKCMGDIATYTYLFMQYYTKYENSNITVNGLLAYIHKSHVSSSGLYTGAATVARIWSLYFGKANFSSFFSSISIRSPPDAPACEVDAEELTDFGYVFFRCLFISLLRSNANLVFSILSFVFWHQYSPYPTKHKKKHRNSVTDRLAIWSAVRTLANSLASVPLVTLAAILLWTGEVLTGKHPLICCHSDSTAKPYWQNGWNACEEAKEAQVTVWYAGSIEQ